ncbi:hypothetical protein F4811DRAFT_548489 [Daldinia bambusicola]|nr:hypothetical protein F4811DRAFT_548489 [Daldinia bambusicola]
MDASAPDADNISTLGEDTPDEFESGKDVSSEDESYSSTEKAPNQDTPSESSSDEDIDEESLASLGGILNKGWDVFGCKAVLYCSRIHQTTNFLGHKEDCYAVRGRLKELAKEEAKLREDSRDDNLPANPFETVGGFFGLFKATGPYLDARCREQEAYDFAKWCAVPSRKELDWKTYTGGFFSRHDEDVFEDPDMFVNHPALLSHLVCVTHLKIRLLLDLRMLQREAKKYGPNSASYKTKMEWVKEHAISEILYKRPDIVKLNSWKTLIADVNDQIKRLYKRVENRNEHYWPALSQPEICADELIPEDNFEPGTKDEVAPLLLLTWKAWEECVPALTAIRIYAVSDLGRLPK